MTTPCITFIGAGNMGASLLGGLIQNGHPTQRLIAADPSADKLNALATQFGIETTTDNLKAIEAADVVILAIKPQVMASVVTPLAARLRERQPLIISVAAGLRVSSFEQWIGGACPIVRAMPNTPALIGHGATGLFANAHVSAEQHDLAETILRSVGVAVWLQEESLIDAVTALSGSGPAYFFYVMEALQVAGEKIGLPADTAKLLTLQTALGAAAMALESNDDLALLRQRVTSPGGTTEQGVAVLEAHHLKTIFEKTVEAAKNRSLSLAKELGGSQ